MNQDLENMVDQYDSDLYDVESDQDILNALILESGIW